MVVKKKKTTKTTKKAKPKTKIVYRTRTVYKDAPKEQSPFGGMMRDTTALVGTGMTAIVGLGVAKGISNTLKSI